MLNKQQSEVWKALGHGEQWVLRDELAELQKNVPAEKQTNEQAAIDKPSIEAKTTGISNSSVRPSKANEFTIQPSSSATNATTSKPTETQTSASGRQRPTSPSRPTVKGTASATTTSGASTLIKPNYGSRHVDIIEARAPQRIEFIKKADWPTLEQAVENCTVCDIGKNRLHAVFGQGQPPANVVLIGEGPGEQEDQQGKIFVGQSGQLLDKILNSLKIKRGEDVAILNTIKCRPPRNANPSEPETAACRPFLERQLELLDPKLIVVMGRPALKWVLRKDLPVKTQRGRVLEVEVAGKMRKVIVTFHPSYLLRTPIDKGKAWLDWLLVLDTMRKLKNDGKSV